MTTKKLVTLNRHLLYTFSLKNLENKWLEMIRKTLKSNYIFLDIIN